MGAGELGDASFRLICDSEKVCGEALYSIKRQRRQKCITQRKKKENLSQSSMATANRRSQTGRRREAATTWPRCPGETGAMMDVRARIAPPNPPGSVNSNTVPRRYRAETAREKKKARNQGGSRLFVPFAKRVIRRRLPQLWSALRSNPVRPP